MSKKIVKCIRPSGRTSGVIPFTPSNTPIEEKFGKGQGSLNPEFNLKRWIRKFNQPRTTHAERYGMIQSIPYIDGMYHQCILMRQILMPLADGLANDTASSVGDTRAYHGGGSAMTIGKLRMCAWFMLTEHVFNPKNTNYLFHRIAFEGFVDDMFAFFRKIKVGLHRSNTELICVSIKPSFDTDEEERSRIIEHNKKVRARIKTARDGMIEYLKYFFRGIWDLKKLVEHVECIDQAMVEKIHREISEDRKFEIFERLIEIDDEWLYKLPWTKGCFQLIVTYVLSKSKYKTLSEVASLNSQTEKQESFIPYIKAARTLIDISFRNGWSKVDGVLEPIDE